MRRKVIRKFMSGRISYGVCACCGKQRFITFKLNKKETLCFKCMGFMTAVVSSDFNEAVGVGGRKVAVPVAKADFTEREIKEMADTAEAKPQFKSTKFKWGEPDIRE